MMENNKEQDLTQGTVSKKLIYFTFPLLLSSLVQQLYNTVDFIFDGNVLGKEASSAIGLSALFINCLILFFGGMAVGTGIVISHAYGEGNSDQLKGAIQNILVLSALGGILLMVLGYFFAPYYMLFIRAPENLYAGAIHYLRTYIFSFIPIFIYNIGSGALRALGNSRIPLFAQFIGVLVHIVMDALLIVVFNVGIHGMGWASLVSQGTAAGIIILYLRRLDESYCLRILQIKPDSTVILKILKVGVPAGIQSLIISLSNILAQYQINALGEDAVAAFTAYFKVEQVIYLPIVALGQAIMTFVGQNIGANQLKRAESGIKECLKIGTIITIILSGTALLFGPFLFRLFSRELSVITLGLQIIHITFPFYFLYLMLQVLSDSLRGAGVIQAPTVISIFNFCILRISLLFCIVPKFQNIQSAAITYPIVWATTTACLVVYYLCNWRKRFYNKKFR